jgi:hypothetical protein
LDGDFAFRHSNCRAVRLIPLAGFRRPDFGTQLVRPRQNHATIQQSTLAFSDLLPMKHLARIKGHRQIEAGGRNFGELHFAILSMIQHSNFDYDYEHETSQRIT